MPGCYSRSLVKRVYICVLIDAECLEAPPNLILSYNVRSHTLGSLIQGHLRKQQRGGERSDESITSRPLSDRGVASVRDHPIRERGARG
jgi:hypothetical protein